MLSVVGDEGRMDMRGHNAGLNPKTVKIQEPAAPTSAKPSESNVAPGKGRQLRPSGNGSSVAESKSDAGSKTQKKPRTMEELDRRVENDALDLLNMKKEIAAEQKLEVKRAMQTLIGVKKEYDVIRAENNVKLAQMKKLKDQVLSLKGVDRAVHESSNKTADTCKELTSQLASVEECVAAEMRTLAMQQLMKQRLERDTQSLKIEIGDVDAKAEKIRHDWSACEATLMLSKKELLERELRLEKMRAQSRDRRKERTVKMNMLHSIVQEGQDSVTLVRSSFFHSPNGSPHKDTYGDLSPSSGTGPEAFPNSPDRGDFNYNTNRSPGRGALKMKSAFGLGDKPGSGNSNANGLSTVLEAQSQVEADEDFVTPADAPSKKAKRMTLQEIEELVERYQTRDVRLEKLNQLEVDLKDNLTEEKQKKISLSEEIELVRQKVAQLASTRQVYKDVEGQSRSLIDVKKKYDECKEKDYRLRVNLVALKRSLPRLLSKLTKVQHPVPSDMQLPDAVNRLTGEISKYFKEIGQELMKEATAEDLANMRGDDDEAQSEIDKLHNMPGFNKIQKELYYNMMGARPDNSGGNVRISTHAATGGKINEVDDTAGYEGNTKHGVPAGSQKGHPTGKKAEAKRKKDELYGGADVESPVIDRAMVKRISALVFERDGKGVIPELAKPKKKVEKKKEFKFRD